MGLGAHLHHQPKQKLYRSNKPIMLNSERKHIHRPTSRLEHLPKMGDELLELLVRELVDLGRVPKLLLQTSSGYTHQETLTGR